MQAWGRTILILGVFWLLVRWVGAGPLVAPDARTIVLWASIFLGVYLVWRDGRPLLARYGLAGRDTPLAILERRLAGGDIDLDSYRRLRDELLGTAGIAGSNQNRESRRVLRGGRLE